MKKMFDLRAFIEKNALSADREENLLKLEKALAEQEATGLVCRGQIGGMVPAGLEMLGINTIFPNGIYVSLHEETKCEKATLILVPKALVVGLDLSGLEIEKGEEEKGKEEKGKAGKAEEEKDKIEKETVEEGEMLEKKLEESLDALFARMQYYPQALLELALDAGQRESRAAKVLEGLAEKKGWQLSYYEREEWEPCTEELSEIDKMIGKKAEDALCERLARCGAKADGRLLTKEMEIDGLLLAAGEQNWSLVF